MSACVFDASAILAILRDEPGCDAVSARLPGGLLATINVAEIAERLELDFGREGARDAIAALPLAIVAPTEAIALSAAALRPVTARAGLSLGDRFCLALAASAGLPAVTADRNWSKVSEAIGIEVIQIRQ